MEGEQEREILRQVFGDSSSSSTSEAEDESDDYEEEEEEEENNPKKKIRWEPVRDVKGLWLCSHFLSPQLHSRLLSSIQSEGWFNDSSHNQAMRFGDLPKWALELSSFVREACCNELFLDISKDAKTCDEDREASPLPAKLLWREPFFDQLIVNVYEPGEGICAHVDLMRFEDGIAIVSLESSCVMHFTRVKSEAYDEIGAVKDQGSHITIVPVFLTPGSLVVMSGEARYLWKHEINRKPGFQVWEGKEIDQKRRTSVTLRKLC